MFKGLDDGFICGDSERLIKLLTRLTASGQTIINVVAGMLVNR